MECRFFRQVYEKYIKLKYLIGKDKVDEKYIYNIDYIDYLKDVYSAYCSDDYCKAKCNVEFCISGDTYIYKQCAKPTDISLDVFDCAKVNLVNVDFKKCNDISYDVTFKQCNKIDYSVTINQCNKLDVDVTINSCNKILSVSGVVYDSINTRMTNNN